MKNIFTPLNLTDLDTPSILSWGAQLSHLCPFTPDPLLPPSSLVRKFLSALFHPQKTTFCNLAEKIILHFAKYDYLTPEEYTQIVAQNLAKVLEQDRQVALFQSPNEKTALFLSSNIEDHPAAKLFYSILHIFDGSDTLPTNEYIQELSDFLMLSYSYYNTLTSSLKTSNIIVKDYHQKMYHSKSSDKVITLRTFYDTIYRIKKKNTPQSSLKKENSSHSSKEENHSQLPLSQFISDNLFDSYLDIELVSNLLRYTDTSKNPFIAPPSHSKYTKHFKMKNFLSSFHSISLTEPYVKLENINYNRLYNHNQYVLERITNANFILGLYNIKNSKTLNSVLEKEINNWIYFPLLTTRLQLLGTIFNSISQLSSLDMQYQNLLALLLRSIRLYHLYFLLPLLTKAFLYITKIFELLNISPLKKSDVRKKAYLEPLKYMQKRLYKPPFKFLIQEFAQYNIDKNLKIYFKPSVNKRLTYFSFHEGSLQPCMFTEYLGLNQNQEIPDTSDFNELSKILYSRFIDLAYLNTSEQMPHPPFEKEIHEPSYAQYIFNAIYLTPEWNFNENEIFTK